MFAPLIALVRDMPLKSKVTLQVVALSYMGIGFTEKSSDVPGENQPAGNGELDELLVASAAGRAASRGLLVRLVRRTAGRGSLGGLVGSAASAATGRGRETIPGSKIRKCHVFFLLVGFNRQVVAVL